jgi:hypothetical protein
VPWYHVRMSLRVPAAIAVGISLIVLPVIIVRAQAEGETEAPPATEVVEDVAEPATEEPQEETEAPPAEEEGSVLGEETTAEGESEPAPEGSDIEAGTETPVESSSASTTPPEFLTTGTASSTASSTEPLPDAPVEHFTVPEDEPFVLQPAVSFSVSGNTATADIVLENLTCKACEKVLPAAQVKAYYTAWYPNDGPDLKEVGERFGEQEVEVSDVALWSSRSMAWSASDIVPGRYYFVIVVDPENVIGAYRMQRMEFAI